MSRHAHVGVAALVRREHEALQGWRVPEPALDGASCSACFMGNHVRAKDPEGRHVRGWVVAKDQEGRVQVDIAMEGGGRSGRVSEWLTEPELCEVYVQPTFRYFCVKADDGTGDVIDNNGRRRGDSPSGRVGEL